MPKKSIKISDYTGVAHRFQRSVNLNSDWLSSDISNGYIITPNVATSLERIVMGALSPKGQRAFALTGPYGTGKSAFAVFLCQLLGRKQEQSEQSFSLLAPPLKKQFNKLKRPEAKREGFLAIPITARRRPIAQLLLEGIKASLAQLQPSDAVHDLRLYIEEALEKQAWQDTAAILAYLDALSTLAREQKFAGLLLFVDEAGKTLEYALQDRGGGDVYIFQELAEYANRQKDIPLLFLITLHQMFDDYVELSDRTLRNEWNKVQERFQSIQFSESAAATMRMVAAAFTPAKPLPSLVTEALDDALQDIRKGALPLPVGIEFAEFKKMACHAWPLHPSVLLAMPYLFRRLAQNERSIFSYLTSHEPFGLQEYLSKLWDLADPFIRLHHIYSYFLANFEAGLARLRHAKRLLEADDIINSRLHLSTFRVELLQTIALFNVLSEICPLRATPRALVCAAADPASVEQELEELKRQSILTYRRFDGSYRVWEGSDVDIEARMNDARRKLQMEGVAPLEGLCRHLPRRTLVARRHGLETGAHRYFNLMYAENLGQSALKEAEKYDDAAGTVVVLLPQAQSDILEAKARERTGTDKRLIIAMPKQIDALRGVVEEVACLRWVEENTEELRDDRIARRELSLRLVMGEQRISQLLQTLLDPRPAPVGNSCLWIWNSRTKHLKRPVDVARLLSTACDEIYHKGPRLRNELVVRKKLSSAAASARRCLLERMLNHHAEERLGMEGYPPERSIYESVLAATGIHYYELTTKQWAFRGPPKSNERRLHFCWQLMERLVFQEQTQRLELLEMFAGLAAPPYGLPDGVHPILFAAFYLRYQDELFLYREGTFVPDVQSAHLELLQRRPDLFAVSGASLDGIRRAVVERLAKGLRQPAKTASVVRVLYRMLNNLPPVTLKTSLLNDTTAMKMRDCLLQAASPEELLFAGLPACFGLRPFKQGEQRSGDIDLFFECLNNSLATLNGHAEELLREKRSLLLEKCGLPGNMQGWHELERRAAWLASRVKHEILTPFINCINNGIADGHNPRPALSLIANRPLEQWTDMDIENFAGLAEGVGSLFRQTCHNYGDDGPKLSKKEEKQKEALRQVLKPQLKKLAGSHSPRALAAALRELLADLELQ